MTKKVENEQGDQEDDRFFVLRLYTVFNVDQVEGKNLDHLRAGQPDTGEPLTVDYQPAEEAIDSNRCKSSDTAVARRSTRPVGTTSRFRPRRPSSPWTSSTAPSFHELVTPLERARVPAELEPQGEGQHVRPRRTHRRDRLRASSAGNWAFLRRRTSTNHIAYVGNWLQAMKNDSRFIFLASAQASKAADFILSFSSKPEEVPEPDGELVTA